MAKRFPPAGGLNSLPEGTLIYEGPESFRQLVNGLYREVSHHYSRPGVPRVAVGEIGAVESDGSEITVRGYSPSNAVIDTLYKAFGGALTSRGRLEDARAELGALAAACEKACVIGDVPVNYAAFMDQVFCDPDEILNYVLALASEPREGWMGDEEREEFNRSLYNFPNTFVRQLGAWDVSEVSSVQLKRRFASLMPSFSFERSGKFHAVTFFHDTLASATALAQEVDKYLGRIIQLGIPPTVEEASIIYASMAKTLYRTNVVPQAEYDEPLEITERLLAMAKGKTPQEFLRTVKMALTAAEMEERHVLETLA